MSICPAQDSGLICSGPIGTGDSRRCTMAGALHYAQVSDPRAHSLPVLIGHDPGDLMQMCEIVGGPGCEQL